MKEINKRNKSKLTENLRQNLLRRKQTAKKLGDTNKTKEG